MAIYDNKVVEDEAILVMMLVSRDQGGLIIVSEGYKIATLYIKGDSNDCKFLYMLVMKHTMITIIFSY